uniref:Torsin-1A-interacting protein 1/2 AAA+ activator domain-containing protein n=1 Tax=Neogobius melanostomus TaxID=47308 RepID=A0A8C6T370_9GOBI
MEDKEAPQQDKDVKVVQTQDALLATNQDNCSEDTNAAPDNKDGASVPSNKESGDKQALSTEETVKTTDQGSDDEGTLEFRNTNQEHLPQEAPAAAEQNVSEKNVETIVPSPQVEQTPISDAPPRVKDGASVPSNKEFGDKQALSTEETAKTTDQGNKNQEHLSQEAPAAAEQNVSEKNVETIVPPPQVEQTPISDAPPRVKDVDIPDGAPVPFNEESGDKSADGTEETTKTTHQDENQEPAAPAAENVETIGPTPQVESTAPNSDVPSSVEDNRRKVWNWNWIWISVPLVAFVAFLVLQQLDKDPPQKTDLRQIDIFHREMENLKVKFPSQREELWKRSRIHLQRHFHISQPTEPVSIILTAGVRAEGTLHCLAQGIASALSSALNVSTLDLDGASKSSQDSDKVKSDIDSQLQKAFEGGKPIAIIHRFEELPPASTLIFYRYCDHENAAFKKTFLIFTILLGEEEEIEAKIRLSEVEEMVTDHLQKKFLSHGHPSAFDKMDIDKYGGLWSRISHLILPVATEKRIEKTQQC